VKLASLTVPKRKYSYVISASTFKTSQYANTVFNWHLYVCLCLYIHATTAAKKEQYIP